MTTSWTPYRIRQLEQVLTPRDVAILEDLERFRLLSTRLIQRLHFPAGAFGPHTTPSAATRGTTRVLNRLEAREVISRLERRIGGIKHGSALNVWQLAATGERYLRARRGDPDRRRFREPSPAFQSHTLEVADLAVSLLERARIGRFDLLELEAEPKCWRAFTGGGTAVILKPDLLVVTADEKTETHSFVEIDRATEHLPTVLRKCHTYQRYWRAGDEQTKRGLFPAVVWITPSESRAEQIRQAIESDSQLPAGLFFTITNDTRLEQLAPDSSPNPKGGRP